MADLESLHAQAPSVICRWMTLSGPSSAARRRASSMPSWARLGLLGAGRDAASVARSRSLRHSAMRAGSFPSRWRELMGAVVLRVLLALRARRKLLTSGCARPAEARRFLGWTSGSGWESGSSLGRALRGVPVSLLLK